MSQESLKNDRPLIPIRDTEGDLFVCDVADAALKDLIPQLEHPFYSLTKRPEQKIRRYEHNGNWLEIVPSVKGLATIYDKDILIYCISQLMEKIKRGDKVGPRLRLNSRDLLKFTNRGTGGKDYAALCESLDRLAGTRINTNIRTGDEEQRDSFGLIDAHSIRRKHGLNGRLLWAEVKLSSWVFNAVKSQEVLTLHRDYFRLDKPLERRVYEMARKHCGRQPSWPIALKLLLKKSGSQGSLRRFRALIKNIVEHDHLPDYSVSFEERTDQVTFYRRDLKNKPAAGSDGETLPALPEEAYGEARKAAPGYDVYWLEGEWKNWWSKSGKPKIHNAQAAFVGFCRKRHALAPINRVAIDDSDEAPAPENDDSEI